MDEISILIVDAGDPLLIMGIAWLAILAMLAWGAVAEIWYLASEGYPGLVRAFDRCLNCSEQRTCSHSLRWGWLGARDPECPNAALFAHARETRAVRKTEAAT